MIQDLISSASHLRVSQYEVHYYVLNEGSSFTFYGITSLQSLGAVMAPGCAFYRNTFLNGHNVLFKHSSMRKDTEFPREMRSRLEPCEDLLSSPDRYAAMEMIASRPKVIVQRDTKYKTK
jgi:hypothetical protein